MKKTYDFLKLGLAVAVLAVFYTLIRCPIKYLTGISCLGCGMTRAWKCVLTLDFPGAFFYHPLWPVPLLFLPFYFCIRLRKPGIYHGFLWAALGAFLIVYLVRLFSGDAIVNIDLHGGLLYRVYSAIFLQ